MHHGPQPPSPRRHRLSVPPLSLETTSWGDGPRRALLVHGASSSAEVWWRLGPELAALDFTVVAPDLRGHGSSPRNGDWSLAGYRADLLALGGGWDVALGHSLGGLLVVAAQAADPQFARALVLEDPALRFDVTAGFLDGLVEEFAAPVTFERLAAARPHWDRRDVETKVRALRAVGSDAIRATFEAIGDTDAWPLLAELHLAVLVVGGDPALDAMVTDEDIAQAGALPHVRALAIPEASHSVHRDAYEALWTEIQGFVSRIVR